MKEKKTNISNRQVAVLSDIHGNRWALEAVLNDIKHRGIRDMVNIGDCLYGPLDPAGTAEILVPLNLSTVRGNEDRIITEKSSKFKDSPTLRYVRERLNPEHFQWLETLEMTTVVYGDFFLCHGSPGRDDEYLLEKVLETGVFLRKSNELIEKLSPREQQVFICGHDHLPRTVSLPDGRLIVNPGSVGLPAYTDDFPFPHAMENYTPHARYSIIYRKTNGWLVENIAVPYDWQSAAEVAKKNGRLDWAEWLRTGRANG
jgi:predicted phosphodiesterase